MTKAEDTVMQIVTKATIELLNQLDNHEGDKVKQGQDWFIWKDKVQAQVEISFKAGIKEVVEWINYRHILSNTDTFHGKQWQAKLKEWEL